MTIDFEASCLPRHGRSYPIEVGVAGDGLARSWLIRPEAEWMSWDWTAEAQALHGLTPDRIWREGKPAVQVWAELTQAIGDRRLVSDSVVDQYWFDILARVAGAAPYRRIDHISALFEEAGATHAAIMAAVDEADARIGSRHRAAADALWLAEVVSHVTGMAGRSVSTVMAAAE